MMDYAQRLVWETEGRRGAAERGWLGEEAQREEIARQQHEYESYMERQMEDENSNNDGGASCAFT